MHFHHVDMPERFAMLNHGTAADTLCSCNHDLKWTVLRCCETVSGQRFASVGGNLGRRQHSNGHMH